MNNEEVEKTIRDYLAESLEAQRANEDCEFIRWHIDSTGNPSIYIWQNRVNAYIARISPQTVRVKETSRYLDLFEDYAKKVGKRLIKVKQLHAHDPYQSHNYNFTWSN